MQQPKPRAVVYFSGVWLSLLIIMSGCSGGAQTPNQDLTVPTLNPLPGNTPLPGLIETEISITAPVVRDTVAATVPSLPPAAPQKPPYPVPGIELDAVNARTLELTRQVGAHWVRRNALNWSAVEPDEGQRNWGAIAGFEAELQAAAQQGLEQIMIVRGAPEWARKTAGYPCSAVSEQKIAAFALFMHDAALRYGQPPYRARFWEIGNEPDVDPAELPPDSPFGCWGDSSDPYYGGGYYAQVLGAVYPAVKSANPDAQVLIGGLLIDCDPVNPPEGKSCVPSRFLEGVLKGGGGEYFDGVSFHAYDYYTGYQEYGNSNWHSLWNSTGPVLTAKARYIRSLLAAYQVSGKFLINSEAGLLCPDANNGPVCRSQEFELTKAAYLAQAHTTALVEGLWANIWYSLEGWRGTALVDETGAPNQAFRAFQFNAGWLAGAAYSRPLNAIPGVRGYEFTRAGKRLQVFWALDDQEHWYKLEQAPQAVFDLFGAPVNPAGGVSITRKPVYVEWEN
ncbi:MAG: hypothetical protein IT297_09740 [Anaerolineae bacterium]|jgi:hypothetical protein|nr:hypothetical protein [Anaerolineae bacterium]MCZ7552824.1 hypothetical protein [Anaerolineales bacterium]